MKYEKKCLDQKKYFPKKIFGQNFLTDKNIGMKIIQKAAITENDNILEIGPGQGFLSEIMLNLSLAKNLIAIEIDKDLCDFLEKKFSARKNFHLEKGDCLKKDWLSFKIKANKLIANIPYNISSEIIFKALEYYKNFDSLTIMVQNEVADRIVSKNNCKNFGVLSALIQKFWQVEKFAQLSPNVFYPKPKVNSAILHFIPKLDKNHGLAKKNNLKLYAKFLKFCFNQRRKILFNRLLQIYKDKNFNKLENIFIQKFDKNNLTKQNLEQFFSINNLKIDSRSENLSVDNFYELFKLIFNIENL